MRSIQYDVHMLASNTYMICYQPTTITGRYAEFTALRAETRLPKYMITTQARITTQITQIITKGQVQACPTALKMGAEQKNAMTTHSALTVLFYQPHIRKWLPSFCCAKAVNPGTCYSVKKGLNTVAIFYMLYRNWRKQYNLYDTN